MQVGEMKEILRVFKNVFKSTFYFFTGTVIASDVHKIVFLSLQIFVIY
jgi:hypothetical protein